MQKSYGVNGGPQITWVNIIATLALLATVAGGAWLLFQQQFVSLQAQFNSAITALANDIKENHADLERLRNETIGRREHLEFTKRLDSEDGALKERLRIIETTRPTAGELQGIENAIKEQIAELKERLRYLEREGKDLKVKVQ